MPIILDGESDLLFKKTLKHDVIDNEKNVKNKIALFWYIEKTPFPSAPIILVMKIPEIKDRIMLGKLVPKVMKMLLFTLIH